MTVIAVIALAAEHFRSIHNCAGPEEAVEDTTADLRDQR